MKAFLQPTRGVLVRALLLAGILPLAFALRELPREWDLLDLHELGDGILMFLLAPPMILFGMLGGAALENHSEQFVPVAMPSLPRLGFALVCDAVFFYLLACAWTAIARWRRSTRQTGGQTGGQAAPS